MDTNTPEDDAQDFPQLRFLRVLVTVLAGVMILGLLVLITLIVIRFRTPPAAPVPTLPTTITLPEGAVPQAVTAGQGWFLVVTQDGRALVYDASGALTSESQLQLP
ncbi:DUF6476 family protein [Pseudooceanicola sp.]|uniref:DUF6476 family protein n=1 Tax=Pseudooceanicola sp. TaxID=1914328 RepID=UPI0035C6B370